MRYQDITRLALLAAFWICGGATAIAADPPTANASAASKPTLETAFDALKTFDWGKDRETLNPIDDAVIASHGNPAARKDLEDRLTAVLKANVSRDAKDYVCRKLMVIGTAACVPALAELLADKEHSHMARYALERIAAPEAAQAMRDALPKLASPQKVGAITSLGARRDASSVQLLAALLGDADRTVVAASLCALGDIGDAQSAQVLVTYVKKAPEAMLAAVGDALLVCAERISADGKHAEALSVYKSLIGEKQCKPIRLAARRGVLIASAASGTDTMPMILDLARDKDREIRSLAYEQVREAARGSQSTERFAALLRELAPEAQVGLIDALAGRDDSAARPAVIELLTSPEETVRVAAIRALGPLGDTGDVPLMVRALTATESEQAAAATSLAQLNSQDANQAIVFAMQQAAPETRVKLLGVLAVRHAADGIPAFLDAAQDANAEVRTMAMEVLGKLAGPEHLAGMLKGVLRAEPGEEREAAEKAVMFVCGRISDAGKQAVPLLAAWSAQSSENQTVLLTTLGRVGGADVLKIVGEAIADQNPRHRDAGIRALCNWPDASVIAQLTELAKTDDDADRRIAALRAIIRVAALRDSRTSGEKLDLLKAAMTMATRDDERKLVLERLKAIREIETLRFVAPYMEQPALAEEACLTVVDLARRRELRGPNKAEFDKALDTVIRISKDADVVDRAKRYQKDQT